MDEQIIKKLEMKRKLSSSHKLSEPHLDDDLNEINLANLDTHRDLV
jgi:hypothetical protein